MAHGCNVWEAKWHKGISNDINMSEPEKLCQINHYDKIVLSKFIAGCTEILRNILHLKEPSLEDANGYVWIWKLYGHFDNRPRIIPKPHTNSYNNNCH